MSIDKRKRFKIFIVDDVPANIQLAANILKKADYDFFYAENGKKALAIAKENDFDLEKAKLIAQAIIDKACN